MNLSDLEVGKPYVIVGHGEMLLTRIHEKTPVFAPHGSDTGSYYASTDQVIRKATREDLDRRHENAKPRGVDCKDRDCWCRSVRDIVREPEQTY